MNVKLAHFELLEEIGHGGLGIVFRAFDPSLNRHVAIKVLKDEFAQDAEFVQDFLRESQNAAAISHPHIAQVHLVGESEGNYYMVMELVNGRSLEQIVMQDGPMPEPQALKVAIEVTEALKAAYVNQMIHGDIKPQNIVVSDECGAKLLDFGLAQLANVEVDRPDGVWGSPYYISPERVGRKAEDFRSDIYSLGATIFEMLVGCPPFEGPDPTQLALKRLNEKAPLLRTLNPNISKRTEQIISKMLQKNVLMRYLDYDSLLNDLRKAEAGAAGREPSTDTMEMRRVTGYITAPVPVSAPRSLFPVILVASLASCLLVGGFFYFLVYEKSVQGASSAAAVPSATPLSRKYGSKIVRFHFRDASAHQVSLIGNFDLWQPEALVQDPKDPAAWSIDKEIPLGVALEYQFVVDGKNVPDPRQGSNVPDNKGSFKTIWYPPMGTPTPAAAKPAAPSPAAVAAKPALSSPTAAPTPVDRKVFFERSANNCVRLLAEFKGTDASREIAKLAPVAPEEKTQKALLAKELAAQQEFEKIIDADIINIGYPLPVEKRGGRKYEGGIYKTSSAGVIVSNPAGEMMLRIFDLTPATLLAMNDYFAQKETDPNRLAQRNWLAGVTAISLALPVEGKALMEKAVAQKPDLRGEMTTILGN